MEIGKSCFRKNHGKLAHLRNLAPKIIYGVNGVIQPLRCAHVDEGRRVHFFGILPSSPALDQMQSKSPSIVLRKVRCVPPWCCTSPLCTQGSPAHTHTTSFAQPISCPLVFSCPTHPQVYPKSVHAQWVSWERLQE
jgi:hypothetical protein